MGDGTGGISPLATVGLVITALLAAAAFWWAWRLFSTRPTSRRGGRLATLRHPGLTVLTVALFMLGGVVWQAIAAFSSAAAPREPYDMRTIEFVSGLAPAAALGGESPSGGQGFFAATRDGLWRIYHDKPWDFIGHEHMNLLSLLPMPDGTLLASGGESPSGGPPGVVSSTDEGRTWQRLSLEGEASFRLLTAGPPLNDGGSDANDGGGDTNGSSDAMPVIYGLQAHSGSVMGPGLYRSFDGGMSWEQAAGEGLPGAEDPIIAISADPHRGGGLVAASAGLLWLTEDGGETWAALEIPQGEEGEGEDRGAEGSAPVTAVAHHPSTPGRLIMYMGGENGGVMEWDMEGGGSPRRIGLSLGEGDAVVALAIDPDNPDIMFAATMSKHIYMTSRGGRMWEQQALYGIILE